VNTKGTKAWLVLIPAASVSDGGVRSYIYEQRTP
jgi:hypothetical protein